MATLDIVILIIIGLAGFSCFRAGFTRSVWGIFAIGAGIVVASQLWQFLATLVQKVIINADIAKWISILALVVITSILADKIFERVHNILEQGILGWLNSLLGLVIGIVTSALIIALLFKFFNPYMGEILNSEIERSIIAGPLMELGDEVWTFGKENIEKHLETE